MPWQKLALEESFILSFASAGGLTEIGGFYAILPMKITVFPARGGLCSLFGQGKSDFPASGSSVADVSHHLFWLGMFPKMTA